METIIRVVLLAVLTFHAVAAVQPFKPAFACKDDDLQWAGMSCSDQEPCPIYLEISTIYPLGPKLVLTGNIHSAQSTLYSVLLETSDEGLTWREPYARVRGAEFDAVQFFNFQTGWISGQRVYPIAGDPFFLITSDGGKSWRKVDVLPEGSDGYIQKFWFDSAKTGTLTLDRGGADAEQMRYARYETMTGGESWSIRETSEKPLTAGPRTGSTELSTWRVRGDPAQKALLVEKKTADGWKEIAALALELARCTGETSTPP